MNERPVTTLFMLMSVDGKISTGADDERDFDKDLPTIDGLGKGLKQYYALEEQTDWHSFNSGRVMAKVGWNEQKDSISKIPVRFVVVDSKPHLTERGVRNLLARSEKLYIVTTNKQHPAYSIDDINLKVLDYDGNINFADLFTKLKGLGADKLTIQSGGELNALLLREKLVDKLSIVVAPLIVGGRNVPTLIDGDSLKTVQDLGILQSMKLTKVDVLSDSYLHLQYAFAND